MPDPDHADLPYLVLGDFSRFLLTIHESQNQEQIDRAVQLIEQLHTDGDSYVREAVTIGLLEGIQNTWEHAGTARKDFAEHLLPESKHWWDSLNRFWQREIPYVGADIKPTPNNAQHHKSDRAGESEA
ncbi:hypothetical protein AAFN60_18135 [Roseibacillus persicicus]|uniref:DUF7674 family protein n=1 Tax=Roseibacillus persicicus TaxID=454148 RepID=UPI00398A5CDD